MTPTILILGDSHVHAFKRALAREEGREGPARIEALRLQSKKAAGAVGDLSVEDAERRLAAMGPGDLLALALRGNHYNTLGLMRHPRPFDVLAPGDAAPEDSAEVVPARALEAYFDGVAAGMTKLMGRLAAASGAPVACIEVPAPKEDAAHILKGAETFFVAHGIAEAGVTPARTRLRLWALQQEAVARACAPLGIRYLPSPEGGRDAAGFLARPFYANDATHANAAYGTLVLRQLEALLAPGGTPEAAPEDPGRPREEAEA